jgi:lipoprotein-anchoring transpeptidase ErfK/SrfK
MRGVPRHLLAIVICVCGVAAAWPSAGGSASSRVERSCTAGSVRWLERWDRAYAGKILRRATVFGRPGAQPFLRVEVADSYGFPTTVPIVAEQLDHACRPTWFRVRVRSYPNGRLGWVHAGVMATSRIRRRIVIDVSRHRLFFYKRGELALSTPAAVGKPGTPTPLGRFYVTQRFILTDPSGPYGARAIGLSAFSDVLRSWRDGGPIGIHGTNEPFSIGKAVSHGCVRLPEGVMIRLFSQVPLATPVIIRR